MSAFPDLDSPRLRLRQPTRHDASRVLEIFSHPEVVRFYNVEVMSHLDEAVALVEQRRRKYEVGQGVRWGIYERENDLYIGSCGFELWHRPWRYAEIGYELDSAFWNQGLMTEALSAIIAYGREQMHLHRVEAQVQPENLGSRRVLEKLGFREEGLARERGYWKGAHHDLVQFGLLISEFQRHQ